jgi:hypothetical protein
MLATQWHGGGQNGSDSLLITLAGDQQQNPVATGGNGGVPTLQVLSGSDLPSWGGDVVVLATFDQYVYRLSCNPSGSRLICDSPQVPGRPQPFDTAFTLEVSDPDHFGGAIKAWLSVEKCDNGTANNCRRPLVWRLGQPRWQAAQGDELAVALQLELVNVDARSTVTLLGGPSNVVPVATGTCLELQRNICAIDLVIPESSFSNLTDAMILQFGNSSAPTASLRYLRSNAQPVVTGLNDAQTVMTGQNLFFDRIRVGDNGPVLALTHASDGSECRVATAYPPQAEGYLSFLARNGVPLPAVQAKGGTASQIHHDASKSAAAGPTTKALTKPASGQTSLSDLSNSRNIGKALQLTQ